MPNPSNRAKAAKDGHLLFFDTLGPAGGKTFGGPSVSYTGARMREISADFGAKREQLVARVRGVVVSTREGDDPIIEVSFNMPFYQFTNEQQDTLIDVLDGDGNIVRASPGSEWTKDCDWIEQWNTGVRFLASGTAQNDAADHTRDLRGVVWTWEFTENENGFTEIAVTGRAYDFTNMATGGPT